MKKLFAWIMASRPVEAWQHLGAARGSVLAGGIAYAALFSLFPALAAGFTVFALVLGNDAALQETVVQAVNDTIGTPIIKIEPDDEGIVLLSSLTSQSVLTITGLIALVGLIITGLGWLSATREGIRAMFGRPVTKGNFLVTKLRDVAALVAVGLVVLSSALSGVVVNTVAGWLLGVVGLEGSDTGGFLLRGASSLVLLAVDFTVLMVLFRFLAGMRLPLADLREGALFGAVALGVIKIFAGLLLGRLSDNEFLATFAVVIGLLVWLNLVARITLLAASWGAVTAIERGHLEFSSDETSALTPHAVVAGSVARSGGVAPAPAVIGDQGRSRPSAGRPALVRAGPEPIRPAFVPIIGTRSADRVSVAAGVVLGASATVAARTVAGGVRALTGAFRRRDSHDD